MKKPVYNLGDLIDKFSILTRKIYFGEEEAISEHRYIEKSLAAYGINGKVMTNAIRLAMMNIEIWNLEHELRMGGEGMYDDAEIAKRALEIRNINRKRVQYKNNLTAIDGGFKEVKINHRSQ